MKCILSLLVLSLSLVVATINANAPILTRGTQLSIERQFVPQEAVFGLYYDLMETAVPGPKDRIHKDLIGVKGDAGMSVELDDGEYGGRERLVHKFQEIVRGGNYTSNEEGLQRQSGILRLEHLSHPDYHKAQKLIHQVVPNNVLQEKGTIHVYLSKPDSAALANHTDVTDIFVLQLQGAKEWLLCQEKEDSIFPPSNDNNLQNKLDSCMTYNEFEIDTMVCHRETLYPGDALFLPKRIVHSARATHDGLSAHLTFGFANDMCSEQSSEPQSSYYAAVTRRFLQSTCTLSDGGSSCDSSCDGGCDSSCNGSCDSGCDCLCNYGLCNGCCDSSCDSSCNSGCSFSCDSSCDDCPSFVETNTGAVIGIAVGVGALLFGGLGLAVCASQKNKQRQAQEGANNNTSKPVEATPVVAVPVVATPMRTAPAMPPMGIEPHQDGTILHA
ncbi:Inherit from NOG: FN3 [Seminavis robusta]|uniref:Bifunctional lysine-specific demethylase and histidyl-hydroxylase n=1 Tax=Seminavis robusta TaxID=568900 RepID=A0A9N8EHF2_9STRA|nr:Inherit from NOG: FN3 [Seminavis robusta]|eukprot:Sro954_g224340.1 Inherit from NOG: FN3 (442) ;mRNA; f:24303-25628